MKNNRLVIALDQGTSSSRAVLYNQEGAELAIASRPLRNYFPEDGWVEQEAEDIWSSLYDAFKEIAQQTKDEEILSVGLTNQRETIVAWDKITGKPLTRAIVWQCRRSSEICKTLRELGLEDSIRKKTGLLLDPYFSASKMKWMLENIPEVSNANKQKRLCFGTVDSWILYRLSLHGGVPVFATEASNSSRTMLYNLSTGTWDEELLKIFTIDRDSLPHIAQSNSEFARFKLGSHEFVLSGILGDQQAALLGHNCVELNKVKCTFGTGAFLLANVGQSPVFSENGLLSTVAWEKNGTRTYAIEGSIFIAGALMQWLHTGLGIVSSLEEIETLAESVSNSNGVIVIPAFVGLGAPYWNDKARGIICGLTRDASKAHIARAALEAVAHQVADLLELNEFQQVAESDRITELRIDGGMSKNKLFSQILADICNCKVIVPRSQEVTAYGAALNATKNYFLEEKEESTQIFSPRKLREETSQLRANWRSAIKRAE